MTRAELTQQRDRLIDKVQRGGAGVVEARRRLRKVTTELMRMELGA